MRLLAALFLTTSALLLTGCATVSGPASGVAPALLECRGAPEVPANTGNSKKVAGYIVDLHDAYSDCHSKLGAVKKVLTK